MTPGFVPLYTRKYSSGTNSTGRVCVFTRRPCAENHLPTNPLHDYGIERMIAEAREALGEMVQLSTLAWLPDVREHFRVVTA